MDLSGGVMGMRHSTTLDEMTQRNIELIAKMQTAAHGRRSLGERVADATAAWVGSWTFLVVQGVLLVIWMIVNAISMWRPWDPFPFVLLNLVLSFEAAFATPVILMSQNRQALLS